MAERAFLDQVNFIQEMSPTVLAADAHLFSLQPAEQIRTWSEKAHTGDMHFRGENGGSGGSPAGRDSRHPPSL